MNFSYPSAPLVSPLTVAFSEENPFIIKLRTFYTEFCQTFFNGFRQFFSALLWFPHLRDWNEDAWESMLKTAIAESILESYSWKWDERTKFYPIKYFQIYSIVVTD